MFVLADASKLNTVPLSPAVPIGGVIEKAAVGGLQVEVAMGEAVVEVPGKAAGQWPGEADDEQTDVSEGHVRAKDASRVSSVNNGLQGSAGLGASPQHFFVVQGHLT